jgi:hypothetical protein
MSSEQNKQDAMSGEQKSNDKVKSAPLMSDFLQVPKKKRRSFVVIASGPNLDAELSGAVKKFIESQYPQLNLLLVDSAEDLVKIASKNIILILVDDELAERPQTLSIIRFMKEQKTDGPLPSLFFTKNPAALITEYQAQLNLWHEVDDYISVSDIQRHALFSRIKSVLDHRNQRRARRFKTNIPVMFQILESGEHKFHGEIVDFSLHGALISCAAHGHQFTLKDQLVVHFPVSQFLKGQSDIMRVSGRVRRVLISGNKAGISWEHLSDIKAAMLTEMLTSLVNVSLARAAASVKQRFHKFLDQDNEPNTKAK